MNLQNWVHTCCKIGDMEHLILEAMHCKQTVVDDSLILSHHHCTNFKLNYGAPIYLLIFPKQITITTGFCSSPNFGDDGCSATVIYRHDLLSPDRRTYFSSFEISLKIFSNDLASHDS